MKINIYEGNTIEVECTVTDGTDVASNLSGYTSTLTIKRNESDVAALLSASVYIS